jgi:hypothetical protein
MTDQTIQPIETLYRGNRFRSRTEARWAVFFDAAGIKWQYELQGFNVGGRNYLPDFWLPQLEIFVEIKPDITACEAAKPLMQALVIATGHRGLLIAGLPYNDEPPEMIHVKPTMNGKALAIKAIWTQCGTCNQVVINHQHDCTPPTGIVIKKHLDRHPSNSPRVDHALEQAQQARFEHGEDGRPEPYYGPSRIVRVYLAGAVIEDEEIEITVYENEEPKTELTCVPRVVEWRAQIFRDDVLEECREIMVDRFQYAAPTILTQHGMLVDDLAQRCMDEVFRADVLFAWIDRHDQIGTLAEIGAAYVWKKPILVAFADHDLADHGLSEHFYFITQLATVAIAAPDAISAWRFFEQWQNG